MWDQYEGNQESLAMRDPGGRKAVHSNSPRVFTHDPHVQCIAFSQIFKSLAVSLLACVESAWSHLPWPGGTLAASLATAGRLA